MYVKISYQLFAVDGRKKRHTYENEDGLTYGDFFTGYPSGMKIRRDLAEFVSHSVIYLAYILQTQNGRLDACNKGENSQKEVYTGKTPKRNI